MGDNCELCQPLYNQKPWQVKSANNGGCESKYPNCFVFISITFVLQLLHEKMAKRFIKLL